MSEERDLKDLNEKVQPGEGNEPFCCRGRPGMSS